MLERGYGSFPDSCAARRRSQTSLSPSQSRCHPRPVQARRSFVFICHKTQYEINIFLGGGPRMVFGPNLQHMAPFGVPTTVFCMVFRHATLVFSTPGAIFGTPIPDLDPGWAGDVFCPKMGPGKRWFCGRNGPPWGCTGFCKRGMDCMVPRRPLGKAVSPQTLPENHFLDLPGFRARFGGRPGPPWWIPYCPFVGQ